MDWLMQLLTDADSVGHILLVYSVVIALGMALGRIKVFGISLGVTCVLFVALAVSYAGITVNGTVLNLGARQLVVQEAAEITWSSSLSFSLVFRSGRLFSRPLKAAGCNSIF